ncbi:uncharacterized protein MONOS_10200 [Monocercomonoides exilis]|uniref:uncharacterized protein n=1 Tax=Monocercomonoides exilis TaxID=2049356 RepID=UPI003559473A|nr:hypothetical protein MONOS_10200 [Monocercomonoides exilis]|eukprot:MONOS_10200.1-p1 / transcript=MONOS_10200.1 / gene=MONOS_10200 / organism=Monocercomonoides_exilis_PA203 / gene_product=unspecified product / transcript_product=unspecified product / location=Mono_scaffold00453:43923-44432(+) / protein_length=170 / sequence_SO=supercontig / SO=protein_coding / is_pseudo=false
MDKSNLLLYPTPIDESIKRPEINENAAKSDGDSKEDGKEEKEATNSLNENGNREEVEGDEDNTKDEEEEEENDDSNNDENEEVILEDSMNNPKSVVSKGKKIKHLSKSKNKNKKNKKKAKVCNLTGIDEDEEDNIREEAVGDSDSAPKKIRRVSQRRLVGNKLRGCLVV